MNHVEIYNSCTVNECSIFFANAKQLTLSLNDHRFIPALFRIVRLDKLRKINLRCPSFLMSLLINLLDAASNCSHLTLNCQLINEIPLAVITNHTNKLTSLVLENMCTIEQIQFFMRLCLQLRYLSALVPINEVKQILEYLLTECGTYVPNLTSFCLRSTTNIYLEKFEDLLEKIRQSRDISIENVGHMACYVWC